MYWREIAGTEKEEHKDAQFACSDCDVSPHEWETRGRCTGPIKDSDGSPGLIQLRIDDVDNFTGAYPEKFDTCPMGLLRAELHPDGVAVSNLVSHYAAADVDKRYPDLPNRLYRLLREYRDASHEKQMAELDAQREGRKHGS